MIITKLMVKLLTVGGSSRIMVLHTPEELEAYMNEPIIIEDVTLDDLSDENIRVCKKNSRGNGDVLSKGTKHSIINQVSKDFCQPPAKIAKSMYAVNVKYKSLCPLHQ